jgi:hypothetical protein
MAFRGPSPAQIAHATALEHLQMMVDRFLMGICGGKHLWDEWRGLFDRFHTSMRNEAPSKDDAFRTFLFTEPKPAAA